MKHLILAIASMIVFCTGCAGKNNYTIRENGTTETFTADELKEDIVLGLQQNIIQLNQQLPIQIDDITELTSAVLNGLTINYNYTVFIDSREMSAQDIADFCAETKNIQKENIRFLFKQNESKMPVNEWIRLYNELGIKYNYNYIDANRRVFAKIVVDFNDF